MSKTVVIGAGQIDKECTQITAFHRGIVILDLSMQSYTQVWNAEISDTHREVMLADMIKRYGRDVKVNDAIAMMAYELADSMMKARNGR